MRQALHIFSKDVRYLRMEVCLLLVLAAGFGWIKVHLPRDEWSSPLLQLAAVYIIARVVHADAIPGDRQFWLTRPYQRRSLAGAKLLFIFVCVWLPIGCAQAAVAVAQRFPLRTILPGLICGQVLTFAAGAMPVMALAAVTSSLVPFIAVALAVGLIYMEGVPALMYWSPGSFAAIPESVDWLRDLSARVVALAIAGLVLLWQYRDRATRLSRTVAIVAVNVAAAALLLLPRSVPLTAQSWLSKRPALAMPVTVTPQRSRLSAVPVGRGKVVSMMVPVSLRVDGLPSGTEVRSDGVALRFEWPGKTWVARPAGANRRTYTASDAVFDAAVQMAPALFRNQREASLTLRGSIFLTLFGDEEKRTAKLGNGPVNVQDGLQCQSVEFGREQDILLCKALFRWPSRLVYAQAGDRESDFSNTRVSYSPFPAQFSFDPVEARWGDLIRTDEITIVTKKPLVHFHRDFVIQGIRLADFENQRWMISPQP